MASKATHWCQLSGLTISCSCPQPASQPVQPVAHLAQRLARKCHWQSKPPTQNMPLRSCASCKPFTTFASCGTLGFTRLRCFLGSRRASALGLELGKALQLRIGVVLTMPANGSTPQTKQCRRKFGCIQQYANSTPAPPVAAVLLSSFFLARPPVPCTQLPSTCCGLLPRAKVAVAASVSLSAAVSF